MSLSYAQAILISILFRYKRSGTLVVCSVKRLQYFVEQTQLHVCAHAHSAFQATIALEI